MTESGALNLVAKTPDVAKTVKLPLVIEIKISKKDLSIKEGRFEICAAPDGNHQDRYTSL